MPTPIIAVAITVSDRCARGEQEDVSGETLAGLLERTEGNPFFLEESVRTLVESGVLVGEPGAYRLAQALRELVVARAGLEPAVGLAGGTAQMEAWQATAAGPHVSDT